MKAIKFTGRNSYGQWFTGNLVQEACTMIVNNVGRFVVEPESVKQFIGVDKHGREIYEGDIVADEFGNEFKASFVILPFDRMELKRSGT